MSRVLILYLVMLASILPVSTRGHAQAPANLPAPSAADRFDEGVRAFRAGQYEAAAEAFLAADQLASSAQALSNAMTAARKANRPLLAAQAAERALHRPQVDTDAVALAHQTLAEVAPRLAHVAAQCSPLPCELRLDGEPMPSAGAYLLPGAHVLSAHGEHGSIATEHLSCRAGASYELSLRLAAGEPEAEPVAMPTEAQPAAPAALTQPLRHDSSKQPLRRDVRLQKGVFYGCGAGALLFAALATWSGVEARTAKELHETDPEDYDRDEVARLARRSDLFLLSSIVFASATVATGVWWVDWKSHGTRVALVPGAGLSLVARRDF